MSQINIFLTHVLPTKLKYYQLFLESFWLFIRGLMHAMQHGLQNLVIECDCLEAVNETNKRRNSFSKFGSIILDISFLKERLLCSMHVSRKADGYVHNLAIYAFDRLTLVMTILLVIPKISFESLYF